MSTSKFTPKLVGQYIAGLIVLLTGWGIAVVTHAGVWGDVWTDKNTLALALGLMVWAGGCASHFLLTGDPSPIMPAAEAIQGELLTIEADPTFSNAVDKFEEVVDRLIGWVNETPTTPPVPVPPPPPEPSDGHPTSLQGLYLPPTP